MELKVYSRKVNASQALAKVQSKYAEVLLDSMIDEVEGGFIVVGQFVNDTLPRDLQGKVKLFDSSKPAAEQLGSKVIEMEVEQATVDVSEPLKLSGKMIEIPIQPKPEIPEPTQEDIEEFQKMMDNADQQANMTVVVEAEPTPEGSADAPVVRKSTTGKPCKLVWDIADANPGMARKDVIAKAVASGVATNTARTQYQAWYTLNKKAKGE